MFIIIAVIALLVQIILPTSWVAIAASWFYLFDEKMYWFIFPAIYTITAIAIPIFSLFSIKNMDSGQIYSKNKNIVFLIINIITIILAISMIIWNGGFIPRF